MGGKQPRKGKYLYIFIAGLISSVLWGCAGKSGTGMISGFWQQDHCCNLVLFEGKAAGGKADFEAVAAENLGRLSEPGPDTDDALFRLGLLYAHPDNPGRDYERAARYFERLAALHPDSCMREQAEIWISVLGAIEKSMQVDVEIEKRKKELEK